MLTKGQNDLNSNKAFYFCGQFLFMMKQLFFVLILSVLFACKNDELQEPVPMAESLVGTWKVIEAKRNNRKALSLENSEFYISQDSFSTNFMPDTNKYPYSYDGKQIVLMDEKKSKFLVSRKTQDTLIFRTEIKNFDFLFVAIPKIESEDENSQ